MRQNALKTSRKIRGPKVGSRTARKSLDLVAFRRAVMQGYDRAAGKVREFKDAWQDGKIK